MKKQITVLALVIFILAQSTGCFAWGFSDITSAVSGPSADAQAIVDRSNLALWKSANATIALGSSVSNMGAALLGKQAMVNLDAALNQLKGQANDNSGKKVDPNAISVVNTEIKATQPKMQAYFDGLKASGSKVSGENAKLIGLSILKIGAAALIDISMAQDVTAIGTQAQNMIAKATDKPMDLLALKDVVSKIVPFVTTVGDQTSLLTSYGSMVYQFCTYSGISMPSAAEKQKAADSMGKGN